MNKKVLIFLSILLIGFLYIFNADRFIRNSLSALNNSISSSYLDIFISIQSTVNKYFNQLDYIEQLVSKNNENQKYKTLYETTTQDLLELQRFNSSEFKKDNFSLTKVKVLSYYKFSDHSKVILDLKPSEIKDINGLISYDGFSAGIVLEKENQVVAYLNHNKKCNYAVYIGEDNAPGITSGMTKDGYLIIKYIPLWKDIKIDDEIITSGMDNIFPNGIKVAKVLLVKENENTKEVLAKPYNEVSKERYFYMVNQN